MENVEKVEIIRCDNGWFIQVRYKGDTNNAKANNVVYETSEGVNTYINTIFGANGTK